jgi:hypothetical protein
MAKPMATAKTAQRKGRAGEAMGLATDVAASGTLTLVGHSALTRLEHMRLADESP